MKNYLKLFILPIFDFYFEYISHFYHVCKIFKIISKIFQHDRLIYERILAAYTVDTFVIFDRASSKQFNIERRQRERVRQGDGDRASGRVGKGGMVGCTHSKMLSTLHSSLDNTKNHIRNATINAKTTHNCNAKRRR